MGTYSDEEIYLQYPRKVGKLAALKAISRAVKTSIAHYGSEKIARAKIHESTRLYMLSPAGQSPPPGANDYRPHPATWFNRGSFLDDPMEWQRPNGGRHAACRQHPAESRWDDRKRRILEEADSEAENPAVRPC